MPQRTRACSICRKKRIKCDGTLPRCLMCTRTGKTCPGPLEGPLIVDMTSSAKSGMKRRRKDTPSMLCAHSIRAHRLDTNPLASPPTTIAFYQSFLNYFTSEGESKGIRNHLTWLQRLPRLVIEKTDMALVLALEATATAYGAIMSSNAAMTTQAQDLYGTALRAHQNVLQKRGSSGDVTIHMVSTSVLLSFFEAMQATTTDAYRSHIYGAARLLEITGPGECAHGVLCQLFYHVRTQMLFVEVATDGCNVPVSVKKILYNTLLYEDPPMIQRLMCYITALQNLQAYNDGEHEEFAKKHERLGRHVDQLWLEYIAQRSISRAPITGPFIDAFSALTVAYFKAAYILLAVHSYGLGDTTDLSLCSQVILDAADFLETTRNAVAYMRIATPLLLVALHAPSQRHRESVTGLFEFWSGKSMRGISVLALDAIRRQREAVLQTAKFCTAGSRQGSPTSYAALRKTPGPAGNDPTPDGFELPTQHHRMTISA